MIAQIFMAETDDLQLGETGSAGDHSLVFHWPGILSFCDFDARVSYQTRTCRDLSRIPMRL